MSVTSLEMFTGTLWDKNPNGIVLLRDDSFLENVEKAACEAGVDGDKVLSAYCESDENLKRSLTMLKKLVRETLPKEQTGEYTCQLDGLMADGSKRLKLVGLQSFGDQVLNFLKSRIAAQYVSVSNEVQSTYELQRDQHRQFMEERGAVLFGRLNETEQIMDYIEQPVAQGKFIIAEFGATRSFQVHVHLNRHNGSGADCQRLSRHWQVVFNGVRGAAMHAECQSESSGALCGRNGRLHNFAPSDQSSVVRVLAIAGGGDPQRLGRVETQFTNFAASCKRPSPGKRPVSIGCVLGRNQPNGRRWRHFGVALAAQTVA